MPSQSNEELTPYFPRVGHLSDINLFEPSPKETSNKITPIFDPASSSLPLTQYDAVAQAALFPILTEANMENPPVPDQPINSESTYLYPTLTEKERLRLTMYWYHTRGLMQDSIALEEIQKAVRLIQDFFGWDYSMVAILGNSTYTRVAAVNLPLIIIPRREATCSHTVNAPPGVSLLHLFLILNNWKIFF